jgi:type IV pilus assembly protein PilB
MSYNRRVLNKKLGQILIEKGVINSKQLDEALTLQKERAEKKNRWMLIGEILVELGYATEEEVITAVTIQYGLPYLSVDNYTVSKELIDSVPAELVRKFVFLPLDKSDNIMSIVISDIPEPGLMEALEKELSCKIEAFVCAPSGLRAAIKKYYG